MMKRVLKSLALGASLVALLAVDLAPEAPLGLQLARDANAIIGAPLTPMSYAGVARRTTRRVVAVEATAATTAAASASAAAAAQPKPPPPPAPPPAAPAGPVPIGTVVQSLPPGCVATPIGGVEYYNCAPGVYYRAAFQGNNLVYVSARP
jgi:hypothetical protein